MSIFIEEEAVCRFDFNHRELLESVIVETLDYLKCPFETEISVVLTDNENIRSINNEFRKIDFPTDVLSFPLIEFDIPADFCFLEEGSQESFNPETGELMLGDIIISIEKAEEQSLLYGHSLQREIAFLTVHSVLHLLGFDHMEEEERLQMEKLQNDILNKMGLCR